MFLSPSVLYYTASALNAVSIPGHIQFGFQAVDPAVELIPDTAQHAVGKATATTAWDMLNGMLASLALLNYQWARTGGPATTEQKLIVWTTALLGSYVGTRYFKVKSYAGLGCLWVAPWLSAAATLWQNNIIQSLCCLHAL